MNAILLFSANPPAPRDEDDKLPVFPAEGANDEFGLLGDPEPVLVVSFVGLSATEQQRAIASFPGGRRCVLATA